MGTESITQPQFECPHCSGSVAVQVPAAHPWIRCPHCEEDFVLPQAAGPGESTSFVSPDSVQIEPIENPARDERDELDGTRIARIASLRRAAYRSRSYCFIATVACAVGALELFYLAIVGFGSGSKLRPSIYLIGVLLLLRIGGQLARKTLALHREATAIPPEPALSPPDLSALSNGSQIARNLENLQ